VNSESEEVMDAAQNAIYMSHIG